LKRFTFGRVIGGSRLLSSRVGASGGYDNAGPWAAGAVHSLINAGVEGGQVVPTPSPCVLPAASTLHPITHDFEQFQRCLASEDGFMTQQTHFIKNIFGSLLTLSCR